MHAGKFSVLLELLIFYKSNRQQKENTKADVGQDEFVPCSNTYCASMLSEEVLLSQMTLWVTHTQPDLNFYSTNLKITNYH